MGAKLYIVEFKHKHTGMRFQQFGVTKEYDVNERFKFKPKQYENFNIEVLASAYHSNRDVCDKEEKKLLSKPQHQKNFWIEEEFSGITETVQMNKKVRFKAIQKIMQLKKNWYEERVKSSKKLLQERYKELV